MYQQMLSAGEYSSASEYDTLNALARQEYEEELAREQYELEQASMEDTQEELQKNWLNCHSCLTRLMGQCNLWMHVQDEGCNTYSDCPLKEAAI